MKSLLNIEECIFIIWDIHIFLSEEPDCNTVYEIATIYNNQIYVHKVPF